ncbi:MAG: hypothetical protein WBG46_11915 [Nonlabens sp.]
MDYTDWLYIGGVIAAFVFFLFWNKGRNTSIKNRSKRNFRESLERKKRERSNKDSLN